MGAPSENTATELARACRTHTARIGELRDHMGQLRHDATEPIAATIVATTAVAVSAVVGLSGVTTLTLDITIATAVIVAAWHIPALARYARAMRAMRRSYRETLYSLTAHSHALAQAETASAYGWPARVEVWQRHNRRVEFAIHASPETIRETCGHNHQEGQ